MTREAITAAALAVAERGNLDAMTMRGLAEELGVTAMALYAHVASKDEILDELIDRFLETQAAPLPVGALDWKAWIIDAAEGLQRVLIRYPALLDRYCRRPVGVPAALRRMEHSLEVLRRAGFDDDASVATYATVHTYTLGFAALEIARRRSAQPTGTTSTLALTEASPQYWPALFAGLAPSEFPNLVRLTPDLAMFTTERQFHRGLRAILDGVDTERVERG
jgi:AcrR family transcriptional regulator